MISHTVDVFETVVAGRVVVLVTVVIEVFDAESGLSPVLLKVFFTIVDAAFGAVDGGTLGFAVAVVIDGFEIGALKKSNRF